MFHSTPCTRKEAPIAVQLASLPERSPTAAFSRIARAEPCDLQNLNWRRPRSIQMAKRQLSSLPESLPIVRLQLIVWLEAYRSCS